MSDESKALAVVTEERSVAEVSKQVSKIQELMTAVMKKDEHYGVIPGTNGKPSLLKAGAEKLCFVFKLAPEFEVERIDFPAGHCEYRVKCRLRSMGSGTIVGEGLGSCSTMESKYRYRNSGDYELTGEPIPSDSKERKAEYRKQGFGMKKEAGEWVWVRYTSEGKVENPDIADVYNTVLKMAKKRAHVDATITACAASDIFTQDAEDLAPEEQDDAPPAKTTSKKLSGQAPTTGKKIATGSKDATDAAVSRQEAEPENNQESEPTPAEIWKGLIKELGAILTTTVGATPAFNEEDKNSYKARVTAIKESHNPDDLREIINNAKAAVDALRGRWVDAGSPTPRPDILPSEEPEPAMTATADDYGDTLDIF